MPMLVSMTDPEGVSVLFGWRGSRRVVMDGERAFLQYMAGAMS